MIGKSVKHLAEPLLFLQLSNFDEEQVISAAFASVLFHTASTAMSARLTTFVRFMTSFRCLWRRPLYEIRLINPGSRDQNSNWVLNLNRRPPMVSYGVSHCKPYQVCSPTGSRSR